MNTSKKLSCILLCFGWLLGAHCLGQLFPPARANRLELQGHFHEAAETLNELLQDKSLPAEERKNLEFELDRLERIKKDFPFTKETLFAALKKSVRDISPEEYEQWLKEGRFDSREIDGAR